MNKHIEVIVVAFTNSHIEDIVAAFMNRYGIQLK
jgi:hypothetical protein